MSETAKPQFSQGDEITIMRGLHRNAKATVLDVDKANEQYAVKLHEGGLAVINFVNVRVPDETSITATQLAEAIGEFGSDIPTPVLERLEATAPGITERVVITKAAA